MSKKAKVLWNDVSVPLRNSMVHWPGDPPVSIERVKNMEYGDTANLSVISMGTHTGTHIDAPMHFVEQGKSIDDMEIDTVVGMARVIEIEDPESIKPEELIKHRIRRGERILFKTKNSLHAWHRLRFKEDFVFVSDDAADFLVDCGIRLIGIDYLSVGSFRGGGSYVHKTLLMGGVWILEGLDLSNVMPGRCELICMPLRIVGGDGAPARAILRTVRSRDALT